MMYAAIVIVAACVTLALITRWSLGFAAMVRETEPFAAEPPPAEAFTLDERAAKRLEQLRHKAEELTNKFHQDLVDYPSLAKTAMHKAALLNQAADKLESGELKVNAVDAWLAGKL